MKKFLMFDLMITPWIIRILYWVMQIGIIFGGLFMMFAGNEFGRYGQNMGIASGLALIVFGSLMLRLFFELIMVQFKISENTSELKELKEKELSLTDKN
jgi:succinate-acetate transporter protein